MSIGEEYIINESFRSSLVRGTGLRNISDSQVFQIVIISLNFIQNNNNSIAFPQENELRYREGTA